MTPTDLETLRGLMELAQLVRPDPWMIVSDWHRYGVMQENHPHQRVVCTVNQRPVELQGRKIDPIDYVGADRIHAEFIAASRNAIPALTALLDELERKNKAIQSVFAVGCDECRHDAETNTITRLCFSCEDKRIAALNNLRRELKGDCDGN